MRSLWEGQTLCHPGAGGWQYGNEWPTPGFYFRLCHRHPGSFSRNFQAVGFKLLGNVSIVAFFARGNREIVSLLFSPFFLKFSSPSSLLVQNLIRCFWDNLELSKEDSHFDVVTPSSSFCAQNQVRTLVTKHDATAKDFMSPFCLGCGHLSNRKCPL